MQTYACLHCKREFDEIRDLVRHIMTDHHHMDLHDDAQTAKDLKELKDTKPVEPDKPSTN